MVICANGVDWFSEDYYSKCIVESYPTFQDDIANKEEVTYPWVKNSKGIEEPKLICDGEDTSDVDTYTFDYIWILY